MFMLCDIQDMNRTHSTSKKPCQVITYCRLCTLMSGHLPTEQELQDSISCSAVGFYFMVRSDWMLMIFLSFFFLGGSPCTILFICQETLDNCALVPLGYPE